jgi:hypothetical protein
MGIVSKMIVGADEADCEATRVVDSGYGLVLLGYTKESV